jgi:hypothetical protein
MMDNELAGNAIVEHVDQREIQKRGGYYAVYPSSYIVCSLLKKYNMARILDVTFGEGRFYKLCYYGIRITGVDPVKRDWKVSPNSFIQMNVFQLYNAISTKQLTLNGFDVVVVDPPKWTKSTKYKKREMFNYIIGTPELIIEYASKIAGLLMVPYILVHHKRIINLQGYKPIHIIEYRWIHRYLRVDSENCSLFIVYSKKQD